MWFIFLDVMIIAILLPLILHIQKRREKSGKAESMALEMALFCDILGIFYAFMMIMSLLMVPYNKAEYADSTSILTAFAVYTIGIILLYLIVEGIFTHYRKRPTAPTSILI